jgi:hypothetical protein
MNFTVPNMSNIQNMQNMQRISKINKKRKYDNFCGNFEIKTQPSLANQLIRENKRLKLEVINLNQRISLLETQLQNLSLVVTEMKTDIKKEIKKEIKREIKSEINKEQTEDEIPSELKMFYYT